MPTKTKATPEEQVAQYEDALDQSARQITALEERNRELSGYQAEAINARDAIEQLSKQLAEANERADRAARDAAAANTAAAAATTATNAASAQVEAALELAAALKKLK